MRKQHTAVTFKESMVVFGGTSENGLVHEDMLVYNFEEQEWLKIKIGGTFNDQYFYQGAACSVLRRKKQEPGMRKVSLSPFN